MNLGGSGKALYMNFLRESANARASPNFSAVSNRLDPKGVKHKKEWICVVLLGRTG
jgi:hypothetical protein